MQKSLLILCGIVLLISGCSSKKPMAALEPQDFAMDCKTLAKEMKKYREEWQAATSTGAKIGVGLAKVATLGIYDKDEEEETMLRERTKALQLLYVMKVQKGECPPLHENDVNYMSGVAYDVKKTKETTKDITEAVQE